jgi:hypothetical protein
VQKLKIKILSRFYSAFRQNKNKQIQRKKEGIKMERKNNFYKLRVHLLVFLTFCMWPIWPGNDLHAYDIRLCIEDVQRLQQEFHQLYPHNIGPRRFNPSVLSKNYDIYQGHPEICYKHRNELTQYIAEMRMRLEERQSHQKPGVQVQDKHKSLVPSPPGAPVPSSQKCSVDQKVALAKAGYTKEEIEQLCSSNGANGEIKPPENVGKDTTQSDVVPDQILTQVANVYSTCNSYQDRGVQMTLFLRSGKTERRLFATAFVRPRRFRFEYRMFHRGRWQQYIIWERDNEVKSFWTISHSSPDPSLHSAIAAATGVSGGTAHTIPRLLMPSKIGGFCLIELEKLERMDDAYLDESECYRLQGSHPRSDTKYTLWIEKSTFLILQIEEVDYLAKSQTKYKPEINSRISEDLLKFK